MKLAEALDDRASFRRYCGFSGDEATPERTTFVRFRKALIAQDLDKALFDEIATQLKAKAIRVKTGTLVDATIIASASEGDDEARWVKDKGRMSGGLWLQLAHVGYADADTALVEEIAITPANVNDGEKPDLWPCRTSQARYSPTARIGEKTFREAVQAKGRLPARRWRPACGVETRGGNVGASWGLEPADPPHSRPYRKNLRNVETKLRPSTHALERAFAKAGLQIRFTAVRL